jgi:ComF family protein
MNSPVIEESGLGAEQRVANPFLKFFDRFLAYIYPDTCQICRQERASAREGYICGACRSKPDGVQVIAEPFCRCCGTPFETEATVEFECFNCRDHRLYFRSARAAVKTTDLIKQVVHSYKYNHALWFEPFLADLFIQKAKPQLSPEKFEAIIPIPLHWKKRWERSFNQSERLARALAKATGIPMNTKLLKRILPTPTQTRLTRAQRAENVKGAFDFRGKNSLSGERIVLVDDILTTGATASECAKVLMQNGAGFIDVWTVARGTLR